jgi:hypothetical protein
MQVSQKKLGSTAYIIFPIATLIMTFSQHSKNVKSIRPALGSSQLLVNLMTNSRGDLQRNSFAILYPVAGTLNRSYGAWLLFNDDGVVMYLSYLWVNL